MANNDPGWHGLQVSSNTSFREDDLIASICRESFYDFVQEFWEVVSPEIPVWNWHIKFLCDDLQTIMERVFLDLPKEYDEVVNVPPGTTKSTVASVMLPIWAWTRKPTCKAICGSFTANLSMDLSVKSRDIVLSEKFRRIFPNITLREDQNTKGYFANNHGGIRYAVGVGGSVMGMHAHIIIIDDPIDPEQVLSEAERKSANNWMNSQLSQRKITKANCPTILIMQRLHQDDPSGDRLSKKAAGKVRHVCLPAEVGTNVRPSFLKKFYKDGLLDPIRLPKSVLADAKGRGEFFYSGQFRQDPVPEGGGMFKTSRLKWDVPPKKFKKLVRYWDKAGTAGGGAFTVGVLMGKDFDNRFWILDVIRGQWDSYDREKRLRRTAEEVDGRKIIIGIEQEPGSGGKESAENTVKSLPGFRFKLVNPRGEKPLRADAFSVQVNAGNVYLVRADWNEEYVEEMKFFPHSKYKDQMDASSGGFTILTEPTIVCGGVTR